MLLERQTIRTALEAKRNELRARTSNREEIKVEYAADTLDNLQLQMNRELVMRKLDADSLVLGEVTSALKRLDSDVFGVCAECEEEIPARRLQAIPWAKYCVPCQERLERGRKQGDSQLWSFDEE